MNFSAVQFTKKKLVIENKTRFKNRLIINWKTQKLHLEVVQNRKSIKQNITIKISAIFWWCWRRSTCASSFTTTLHFFIYTFSVTHSSIWIFSPNFQDFAKIQSKLSECKVFTLEKLARTFFANQNPVDIFFIQS